jgi:two-component system response regulator AtoC
MIRYPENTYMAWKDLTPSFRLQVIPIEMPPLREHPQDIELLCHHFLAEFNQKHGKSLSFSKKSLTCLNAYIYPGNVRELRNITERASVLCKGTEITPKDLPQEINNPAQANRTAVEQELNLAAILGDAERDCLLNALQKSAWNKTKAAELLGISRKNLWEKLKTHDIS